MKLEDIKIGAWIIWETDTYPHPRQITDIKELKKGTRYYTNQKKRGSNKYIKDPDSCELWQIKAARLCTEEEIPEEFRIKSYEIY